MKAELAPAWIYNIATENNNPCQLKHLIDGPFVSICYITLKGICIHMILHRASFSTDVSHRSRFSKAPMKIHEDGKIGDGSYCFVTFYN